MTDIGVAPTGYGRHWRGADSRMTDIGLAPTVEYILVTQCRRTLSNTVVDPTSSDGCKLGTYNI